MSEEKSNVSIVITDNKVYPEPSTQSVINPRIQMTKEEMKDYAAQMEQSLKKNEIAGSLCAEMIHIAYNQHIMFYSVAKKEDSDPLWYPLKKPIDDNLLIEIVLRPQCICSHAQCARTLMTGGCIDPYGIEIGKKFFPKAYEDRIWREHD